MEESKIVNVLEKIELRLAGLEEGQKKLEGGQEKLEEGQKKLEGGQEKLEGGQEKLKESQETISEEIKKIGKRLEATFQKTGENFEEIQEIKGLIRSELKNKADMNDFQTLENRVAIIERRLKLAHK